jgi:hypothetical protein
MLIDPKRRHDRRCGDPIRGYGLTLDDVAKALAKYRSNRHRRRGAGRAAKWRSFRAVGRSRDPAADQRRDRECDRDHPVLYILVGRMSEMAREEARPVSRGLGEVEEAHDREHDRE